MDTKVDREIIKILVVEDNEDDLFFIKKALSGERYQIHSIFSGEEAYNYLINPTIRPDIILLDYKLPGMNGLQILKKTCSRDNDFSFIFLTVDSSISIVVEAMKAGALDFIVKSADLKNELPQKVEKVYEIHRARIEKKRLEEELVLSNERAGESEEKYRAMYNNAPLAYQSLNSEGCFIDVNPMWLKTLGYEREEVIGSWFGSYLHPEYVEHFKTNFPAFKARGYVSNVQFKIRKKNGDFIDVSFEGCIGYTSDEKFKQTYCVFKDITDQKRAEEAHRQSEDNHQRFMDESILGIRILTKEGKTVYVNNALLAMYGFNTIEEFYLTPFSKRYTPQENLRHEERKGKRRKGKELESEYEIEILRKDGKIRYLEVNRKEIIWDKVPHFQVIYQDITERKHAVESLRKQDAIHTAMIENIGDVIEIIGVDGIIKYLSANIERFFGWKPEEFVGFEGWHTIHQDDIYWVKKEFFILLEEDNISKIIECRLKCKNGCYKWIELTAINKVKDPDIVGVLLNYHDITDRKLAVETLKESEEKYSKLFQETIDGIALHTLVFNDNNEPVDYITLDVNEAYENIFHIKKGNIIGKKASEFLSPDELKKWLDIFAPIAMNGGSCLYNNFSPINKQYFEGNVFSFQKNLFAVVFRDVSERIIFENELLISKEKAEESDRLKSSFLQNMSHEVRTPLNAIVGFTKIMAKPNQSPEKLNKYSNIISSKSDQLIGIITDVIEISQIQAKQIRLNHNEFDIIPFINDVIRPFVRMAKDKNLEIETNIKFPFNEYLTITDQDKLKKILRHIIDNAIKFTLQGSIQISCEIENNVFKFSVMDTGIGIATDMQGLIFEPFLQVESGINRKFGGNGLGLAIARAYTELLGGTISLESELNTGTKITVRITFNNSIRQNPQKDFHKIQKGYTVLIAEDEYSNYQYLLELFEGTGIEVLHASNGKIAVELFKSNQSINLVLMDIKMPVMDGQTAAKQIKKIRPSIPVIAQTAYALENEMASFLNDFDGYITKPINEEEFKQQLKKYIEY